MAVAQNKVVSPQGLASGQAVCTVAKVTYNDLANAVKLVTAGPNGALLFSLTAEPRASVVATQLQAYRSPDGIIANLFNLLAMSLYTMAAGTAPVQSTFGYGEGLPLRLAPNEQIWVGIGVAVAGGIAFDATWENL